MRMLNPEFLATQPHFGVVWKSGWVHNVTWDLTEKPVNITNPIGTLYLRANGTTLQSELPVPHALGS